MAISKWGTVVRECLLRRISVREWEALLRNHKDEIQGKELFSILLECRTSFCAKGDPLISMYIETLGAAGILHVSDALVVLITRWNKSRKPHNQEALQSCAQSLQDITLMAVSSSSKPTTDEIRLTLELGSRWLATLARVVSQNPDEPAVMGHNSLLAATAFLVATLSATEKGLETLSQSTKSNSKSKPAKSDQLRSSLKQAIELAIPLYPAISAQIVERLSAVQKHLMSIEGDTADSSEISTQNAEMEALQFQMTIADMQMVAAKAATMMYLENMLFSGATIDDNIVLAFLSARHQADYASMFADLLIASFNVFKRGLNDSTGSLLQLQCQIFLQNKLPTLLSLISVSAFGSFSSEDALSAAWHQLLPQLANHEAFMMTASRFLHTCTLHHLTTAQSASQLIANDELVATLSKGLYSKDDLVSQVMQNHTRGPKLVEELVKGEGSAGFLSQALVEIMHNYCQNKETQYLKDLANAILRKPAAINCISMFIKPSFWLGPFCSLLDDWVWTEIHGEAQPVYDEFGSIFLLILVTRSRLSLLKSELGISKKDGFLAKYLDQEGAEASTQDLSGQQTKYLADWINALYLAEGLSDELFSSCSPHDFYLIIPTLLRQSVIAFQRGKLTRETLKAGLEYLLESFLLPSLVSTLAWSARNARAAPEIIAVLLEVLTKSPESSEFQEIHQTILSMSASTVKEGLQSVDESKFSAVMDIFNKCPPFSYPVDQPITASTDTVLNGIQQQLIGLITSDGDLQFENQTQIPSMVEYALRAHGPELSIRPLIEVLLQLSSGHSFLFALDVIATLVCISPPALRSFLHLQYNGLSRFLKKNEALVAEATVRLHRLVEQYIPLLTPAEMSFALPFQQLNIDTTNANLDGMSAIDGNVEMTNENGQGDSIDQVLDEAAVLNTLDNNMDSLQDDNGDINFDSLNWDGDGMGMDDLDNMNFDNMF